MNIKILSGMAANENLAEKAGRLVQLQENNPLVIILDDQRVLKTSSVKSFREDFTEGIYYIKTSSGSLYIIKKQ